MGSLLTRHAAALVACSACGVWAAESDRHVLDIEASAAWIGASTELSAWPEGGLGKLRVADDGVTALRLFGEYRGRIAPTLGVHVVADYLDDGASGAGLTEAFLDWRPIPRSRNQQQWRFGAFYPPLSLENGERGWESPFTYSYSAINTWLGEEVRPVGAEWSLRRRLEGVGRGHEIRAFAAGFYGNDPAATLLFWRGWSLHDRQSRFGERLGIPPIPLGDGSGTLLPQPLKPFTETDHEPGAYGGVEWRYAQRALVQLARYDNRADTTTFRDGMWGWRTDFSQISAQVSLPAELGFLAQWMRGSTDWISGARPDGTLAADWSFVEDEFESAFVLLTRRFGRSSRATFRYDTFEVYRPGLTSDSGHAWTLSYRIEPMERLRVGVEWLEIVSTRDAWSLFYGEARQRSEEQLRVQIAYRLGVP
jgi:hypothetical protein